MALATAGCVLVSGCRAQPEAAHQKPAFSAGQLPVVVSQKTSMLERAKIEAQAHYATGILLAVGAETGPALEEFYAAALNDLENEPLALEVAGDLLQLGQAEKALTILERSTRQPEASGEAYALLGTVCLQLNRPDSAAVASRNALKKNPRLLAAHQTLFQIELLGKRGPSALGVLDEAGRVTAPTPEFLTGLGELALRLGWELPDQKQSATERARAFFQSAKNLKGQEPELELRLAEGFVALGQFDEAAGVYLDLLNNFPELPLVNESVRAKLGDLFLRTGNRRQTAELLQLVIRGNPTDARANYFLGSLASEQTNFVQAAECYARTVLLNPDFEPAYGELANMQLALNRVADAQATLAAARKKFPRRFVLEYLSGLAASRQKNYTNALEYFTAAEILAQASGLQRLSEAFYFQLGSAYERLGDLAQAEKNFLKCLELAPNFDDAQNYLGFMWAEHGRNLNRARELIGQALQADPKNPAYLDSMAWVLFKLNQPGPALEFELQAVAGSAEADAEIYHHLGDIYAALGQTEKARAAWRESVKLEPDEQVRKKLELDPK